MAGLAPFVMFVVSIVSFFSLLLLCISLSRRGSRRSNLRAIAGPTPYGHRRKKLALTIG